MSDKAAKVDRILRALGHPVRRQILRALADHPGSASSMAREFKMELGVVSYHLNRVLAAECDAVDLVEKIQRRGSIEKVYRLKADLWTELSVEATSEKARQALRTLSLGECLLEAVEAIDAGALSRLEGSTWGWFRVSVDSKVWNEIQAARREFNQKVEAAVEASGEGAKAKSRNTHDVVVGVAAFPVAQP